MDTPKLLLMRAIGWTGIVLAVLILLRSDQDQVLWRAVIVLGGALLLLYLPDDYEFTLRHLVGLAVLFCGFWMYYVGVENWEALVAFGMIVAGGYLADILSTSDGDGGGWFSGDSGDGGDGD